MKKSLLKQLKRIMTMTLAAALVFTMVSGNYFSVYAAEDTQQEEALGEDQQTEDQQTEDQQTEDQQTEDQQTEDQNSEDQNSEDQNSEDQNSEDQQSDEGDQEDEQNSDDAGQDEDSDAESEDTAQALMLGASPSVQMMSVGISSSYKLKMTVTDQDGKALSGASVTFTYYDLSSYNILKRTYEYKSTTVTTGADGTATASIGTNYEYVVAYSVSKTGYSSASKSNFSDYIGSFNFSNPKVSYSVQLTINQYAVSYVNDDDSSLLNTSVKYGSTVASAAPATPVSSKSTLVDGVYKTYTFTQWALVGESLTPVANDYAITAAATFKALYAENVTGYTISYAGMNAGENPDSNPTVWNTGTASITLTNPVRTGYTFLGWTWEGQSTPVLDVTISELSGPVIYTANWQVNSYTVNYHYLTRSSNKLSTDDNVYKGTVDYMSSLVAGAPGTDIVTSLFETTTLEYTFTGEWYYDEALTMKVDSEDNLETTEGLDLYAGYSLRAIVWFYVLNPGLSMPDEAGQYSSANYSNGVKTYGAISSDYDGSFIYNKENLEAGLDYSVVFTEGFTLPTGSKFKTSAGKGSALTDDDLITWYVVKYSNDKKWHIDGFINNQYYPVTINYVYDDDEKTKAAESYTGSFLFESDFGPITSPEITNYKPSEASISGTMVGNNETAFTGLTYTVVYSEITRDITVEYYKDSTSGTLVGSKTLSIGTTHFEESDEGESYISDLAGLNAYQPGYYYDGVVVYYSAEEAIMKIVYTVRPPQMLTVTFIDGVTGATLKTESVASGNGATAPATLTHDGYTFTGWDKDFSYISANITVTAIYEEVTTPVIIPEGPTPTAPTPTTPEEPEQEEPTVIEEEETPLATTPETVEETPEETVEAPVTIEEEAVPEAVLEGDCIIHWIILLLTAMYAAYGVIRAIARSKKIRQLQESAEQVNA